MRKIIPMNQEWLYKPSFDMNDVEGNMDGFESIQLPHANKEIPYNCFDENMYQFISCYKKEFSVKHDSHERVFIDFEGVMTYAEVFVNGQYVGEHKGGYTPFSFDITDHLKEHNVLTVKVDSTERDDIPPFGFVIDYLCYGGIYREVNLRVVHENHIENVFAKPYADDNRLIVEPFLNSETFDEVRVNLCDGESVIATGTSNDNTVVLNDLNVTRWTLDEPKLYEVVVELVVSGEVVDTYKTRIGFRTATFTKDGFFLNGKKLKIRGLNRHQSFPYVGYAMPKRAQIKDADICKYELGLNLVRTSHYPQSRHFLDRCDEIGLLVFEEIPGWQHIGDEAWKAVACENVKEMIERDWNHPSIILWGTRINESQDDHDFYQASHEIAKSLDDTRQTGGVRCFDGSELLEDVYTMNDFNSNGTRKPLKYQREVTGLDYEVPYLVTEYNGHMYPTKRFDSEERQAEHARRHVIVQNDMMLQDNISGAIGWCAFDYNTHYQFGSGDRICYHGVMDMFRIPKFASNVYKSQSEHKYVLEPVTLWARGEKGEFDGRSFLPVMVLSNCEKISVTMGGETMYFEPEKKLYRGLKYPPFEIKGLRTMLDWGLNWYDATIKGYVNDEVVIEKHFVKDPMLTKLDVKADDLVLNKGDYDVTRIVIKAVDQVGNIMPYSNEIVHLNLQGVGEIIGPNSVALIGGCIAFWVKTTGEAGAINVSVSSERLGIETVSIEVK